MGSQQGGHQLPDDSRAAAHVDAKVRPGRITGDRQVHDHRVEELRQELGPEPEIAHRVPRRGQHGLARVRFGLGSQCRHRLITPPQQGRRVGACRCVHELVGDPGEGIQSPDIGASLGRQQKGGEVEGATVRRMNLPAVLAGRGQIWSGLPGRPALYRLVVQHEAAGDPLIALNAMPASDRPDLGRSAVRRQGVR